MAQYAVERLRTELRGLKGKSILILGLAYREEVKETSFSPAWRLIEVLEREGAKVYIHDPLYSRQELESFGLNSVELEALPLLDAVVLHSNHSAYRNIDFAGLGCSVVLDGRNVLDKERITQLGMKYVGIGR